MAHMKHHGSVVTSHVFARMMGGSTKKSKGEKSGAAGHCTELNSSGAGVVTIASGPSWDVFVYNCSVKKTELCGTWLLEVILQEPFVFHQWFLDPMCWTMSTWVHSYNRCLGHRPAAKEKKKKPKDNATVIFVGGLRKTTEEDRVARCDFKWWCGLQKMRTTKKWMQAVEFFWYKFI